ncbi:hypothetical protein [Novacetimonas hansenii]|uniref:hypothetical protein n=1 Tax=Novacetimonas hansenii TaxID=436 RepID=UPI000A6E18EA|nr:hypothetical protein [Novacetimonas hansenii]
MSADPKDPFTMLRNVAALTRWTAPITEEERTAFCALPKATRVDILARMLQAMRVLYHTHPGGIYFVFADRSAGAEPCTYCLTEGPNGARHELPDYETVWLP